MKTLIIGTFLACFGLTFSVSASPDTSCAFDLNENLTLTTQLHKALPGGIWSSDAPVGQEIVLQFYDSGTADWFTYNTNGLCAYKGYSWSVIPVNENEVRLELSARDNSRHLTFEVEIACHSITLTDRAEGLSLALKYESTGTDAQHHNKEQILAGKWENTTYPFDLRSIEGAYLKYSFHNNGRFDRLLGCAGRNIKESGEWWLAKDGQHLVMRLDNGETTIAEIKYLELDEMVLHHVLSCEDRNFATGDKDFFFNRQ